jgi:hypothetical protein
MLGVSSYSQAYVDACRASVALQLKTYRALAKTGKPAAVAAFEPVFFGNLVLALDASFVHRLRGKEGKDGNPLNEVRMLCTSVLEHDGVLTADSTIKYKPGQSVLGYDIGDTIALREADFVKLSKAFLAEIEAKFVGS